MVLFLASDRIKIVLVFQFSMAHPYSKVSEVPTPLGPQFVEASTMIIRFGNLNRYYNVNKK